MEPLAPHYHVGIVVPDVAAAREQFAELLGVTWGPILHLDATEYRDGTGADVVLPTTFCYSVEEPRIELLEEVPGLGLGPQRALQPPSHRFLERRPARRERPPRGRRLSAAVLRPGRSGRAGLLRLPPQRARSADRDRRRGHARRDVLPLRARRLRAERQRCTRHGRQVRVHGPGDVRVDDVPRPRPGPRDVVVRVTACGICGSDLSYIKLGGVAGPTGTPMCLGHEMAGVVDWVGAEVTGAHLGDRVVVQPGNDDLGRIGNGAPEGGLTPLLLVTEADRGRLHPVPDDAAARRGGFRRAARGRDARRRSGRSRARRGCGGLRVRADRALGDRHPRRPRSRAGRRGRSQPGPARPRAIARRAGGARPGPRRRLGRARPAARHPSAPVRSDARDGCVHRGVGFGPGDRRSDLPRSGRRATRRSSPCTTSPFRPTT